MFRQVWADESLDPWFAKKNVDQVSECDPLSFIYYDRNVLEQIS